ncbi:hypothetical protein [Promicromonospora soli]|uniref:Glycosyl hydrolase-like 10 domain-containing protein n=1 Tax=Promicromonospora soli TaxID=2035533 RepID=A0A919G426_9MICO|nr:hypothetical protein [Promicromonospora soli]GHH77687.1 hypothetical protein GCM10017772_39320 [Promicromonospora soli]
MTDHHAPRARRILAAAALAATLATTLAACSPDAVTVDRPLVQSDHRQSISLGIEDVADPDQDWDAVRQRLDEANANMVTLAAGRVEFTAFDWSAHPDAAAEAGRDHLAHAINETARGPDDEPRLVDLLIDALIPSWIKQDPTVAGVRADGSRSRYFPSATALHDGPVGERYLELLEELARRYQPDQITFTEFKFDDETYGDDDAALYREMTGAQDWPRLPDGSIDEDAPEIAAWRSQVVADFLERAGAVLDDVAAETGKRTDLAMDALIDWDNPDVGRPDAGLSYPLLARHADRVVLWVYLGIGNHTSDDVEPLTAALARSDLPTDKLTLSVGLWDHGTPKDSISPQVMADAARAARTNGITSVNVTPYTLMTAEHWSALSEVWTRLPPTSSSESPSTTPSAESP